MGTEQRKIRLGLVGVGGVGAGRLDEALAAPEAEVAAICDASEANLKAGAEKAPNAKTFSDAEKLFASGLCEAVLLNVPHFLHKPFAVAALQAGLNVLVEKPMAIRIGECDAMLAEARKAGKILTVHHQRRIGIDGRRRLVREGGIGKLVRATYLQNGVRNNKYYRTGKWRGTWKYEGGGVLVNQCIHDIDAFVHTGGQVAEVRAKLANLFHDHEVEDSCTAALEYPNGATGTFAVNISSFSPSNVCEFEGDRAVLVCGKTSRLGRLPGGGAYDFYDAGDDAPMFAKKPETQWQDLPAEEPFAPGSLVRDFAQAVRDGRAPLVDAEGAREAVHFFNALVLSHFLEKPMRLPLDPAQVDEVFDALAAGKMRLHRAFTA
ncbi:MAG: Gfo/Idh/MocA family oxidoreductase [Planctomycetota bacterium]|nr:Gfo/Idh/MocA family oxidoreductase [Planctomycetota bacterium]